MRDVSMAFLNCICLTRFGSVSGRIAAMASQPVEDGWLPGGWVPKCKNCEESSLVRTKVYRLGWPFAVIGFIFLIPSVVGIVVSALTLVGVLSSSVSAVTDFLNEAVTQMRAVSIPEPIIGVVIKVTLGETNLFGGRFAIGLLGTACVGGLLGWLLIRKKPVLRCSKCGDIISAQ